MFITKLSCKYHIRAPLKIHISSQLRRCDKIFLFIYQTYTALLNFYRALYLSELWLFRGTLKRRIDTSGEGGARENQAQAPYLI